MGKRLIIVGENSLITSTGIRVDAPGKPGVPCLLSISGLLILRCSLDRVGGKA